MAPALCHREFGTPGESRTLDYKFRKLVSDPPAGILIGASMENRTPVIRLETSDNTIIRCPLIHLEDE